MYKSPEVVTSIKVSRLQWAGHVQRRAEHEIPKKIMGNKFEGKRNVGRPRLRWMDGVLEDLRKLRINSYSAKGLGDRLYATLHKMPGEDAYSFCLFLKSNKSPLYTSGSHFIYSTAR